MVRMFGIVLGVWGRNEGLRACKRGRVCACLGLCVSLWIYGVCVCMMFVFIT